MRLSEIIAHCDTIKPNTYSFSQKKKWLMKIESDIRHYYTLYSQEKADMDFLNDENPLLLLDESKEDIYLYYLISMIDLSNQEYSLYNNSVTYFNSIYGDWKKEHRRTHRPICSTVVKV